MHEIYVTSVLDGSGNNYTNLVDGLELPASDEAIAEAMRSFRITEQEYPLTASGYRFRLNALNGTVTGERRLDELNRFAKYLSTLQEKEREQLTRFAGRRTRLTPTECMVEAPLFIGEDTREFTVAVIPEEYHSVPSVGYLQLPASPEEFIDALDWARVADAGYSIEVWECRRLFLRKLLPREPELFELNHLAERLSTLDETESLLFEAMVAMEKKPDVARLINLTHNLDNCVIVSAGNLPALGKFALDNGFFPEFDTVATEMFSYLNYEALGRRFQEENGGVFAGGFFITNLAGENEMKTPYSGRPPVPDLRPDHVLRLLLECSREDGRTVWLGLPAGNDEMDRAAGQLGWESLEGRGFIRCQSGIPKLDELLTGSESIHELSDFAEHLQYLRNQGDLPKYKAALEIAGCSDLAGCVALAENLGNYTFYPEIVSEYDYGEWELLGMYKLDATCPGMEHFHFAAFGRERMQENGVVSTPYGMIRETGPEQELTEQPDASNAGMQFG